MCGAVVLFYSSTKQSCPRYLCKSTLASSAGFTEVLATILVVLKLAIVGANF